MGGGWVVGVGRGGEREKRCQFFKEKYLSYRMKKEIEIEIVSHMDEMDRVLL